MCFKIAGQDNLLLNGGFDIPCLQKGLRIDGQLMDTNPNESFFLEGDIFSSGNMKSLFWSCQSEFNHESHFWFNKDSIQGLSIFARLRSQINFIKDDEVRSDSIFGTLKRPLLPGELIKLSIWFEGESKSTIDLSGEIKFQFLSDLEEARSNIDLRLSESISIVDHSTLDYVASGGEKYILIKSDVLIEGKKEFKKEVKRRKRKGSLRYLLYETIIDSISIEGQLVNELVALNEKSVSQIDVNDHQIDSDLNDALLATDIKQTNNTVIVDKIESRIFMDTLLFSSFYFAHNSYVLNKGEAAAFNKDLNIYLDNLNQDIESVLIYGCTDNTGTLLENKTLSEKRAEFVARILEQKLRDATITTKGLGICNREKGEKARRSDVYFILH